MKSVKSEFTEKNLTGNAGLKHFGKFIDKLDLPEMLENHISIPRGPNAEYQAADAILMLTLGVFAGAKHMSHLALLREDEVIRSIFGWKNSRMIVLWEEFSNYSPTRPAMNFPKLKSNCVGKCGRKNGLAGLRWTLIPASKAFTALRKEQK